MHSFLAAVGDGFRLTFVISGRASRSRYWLWWLFLVLLIVICTWLDDLVSWNYLGQGGIASTAYFLLLVPTTTYTIRRLHDADLSGWWVLISLIPCGGIVVLIWNLRPGSPSSNRFGPPPAPRPLAATEGEASNV
jgi:uncharacterized membrane protein YhaH (DUF805 family)